MGNPVPRIWFVCQMCGARFGRMACEMKRPADAPKYCSRSCKNASQRDQVVTKCFGCGSPVSKKRSEVPVSGRVYCTRLCYDADRTRKRKQTTYPKIGGRHIHRVIAEQILGRKLKRGEVVHHKDGNIQNFKPDNLEVLKNQADHQREHFTGKKQSAETIEKRVKSRQRTLLMKKKVRI